MFNKQTRFETMIAHPLPHLLLLLHMPGSLPDHNGKLYPADGHIIPEVGATVNAPMPCIEMCNNRQVSVENNATWNALMHVSLGLKLAISIT
jgi:hypothetical protein